MKYLETKYPLHCSKCGGKMDIKKNILKRS